MPPAARPPGVRRRETNVNVSDLPIGSNPPALVLSHFPNRLITFVWRNWELVPPSRLAEVLQTSTDNVIALAAHLGLRVPPRVSPAWLQRGYVTLIRANWHLLPYDQLLVLLGWSADQLDFALREDDFLWIKLGLLKPACAPLAWAELDVAEREAAAKVRDLLELHFPTRHEPDADPPFGFLRELARPPARVTQPRTDAPFDSRIIYSYAAVYGDPLLEPELDPFPAGLLARLADHGVNGVWLQGLLYTLYPWAAAGERSAGWERRLAALESLCARAGRYGVGVHLYLNEPRAMPFDFFDANPDLKGVEHPQLGQASLCTSQPAVLDYLRTATEHLFRHVPQLAGFFTISMSENPTHCWSHHRGAQCPRCADRDMAEVIAEVNTALAEGAWAAKPDAQATAWAWAWPNEVDLRAIDLLPAGMRVQATSEEQLVTRVGGVEGAVVDYTISQPGPGPKAPRIWARAQERGLPTSAKIQANNTWELSSVPWIPVPHLVEEHVNRLRELGVDGIQLSWTLGGWPSPNHEVVTASADEVLRRRYGEKAAPVVIEACRLFARAFREYPFHIGVAYNGPQQLGPANLLYPEPTGWNATMVCFAYDTLGAWRAIYPEDVFENQWRKLSEGWQDGLELLRSYGGWERDPALADLERVADACWCHFRSVYHQVFFTRRRESADPVTRAAVRDVIAAELDIAKRLEGLVRADSRFGFEATNHYYYTVNDLREKVINCAQLLEMWSA